MRPTGLFFSVALLAAGCNTSQTGANGNVRFTPMNCGVVSGCDFADSIGVGGAIDVQIAGIGGFSTAGVTLVSDDPSVLSIDSVADAGGKPTWEAVGQSAGVARISAYDSSQTEVDFVEVGVQDVTGLALDPFVGNAVGPTSDSTYGEIWQVNANENTSFYVLPTIGDNAPTMGRFTYTATIDSALNDAQVAGSDPGNGYLYFNVPAAGDYTVTFENDYNALALNILIQAQ